jgi:hypothetical protein
MVSIQIKKVRKWMENSYLTRLTATMAYSGKIKGLSNSNTLCNDGLMPVILSVLE